MGSGSDFGGKPDSLTAGRLSSQSCKEEANGNWIIDTVGQTSAAQARLRDYPVLGYDPHPGVTKFTTSVSPHGSNPEKYRELLPAEPQVFINNKRQPRQRLTDMRAVRTPGRGCFYLTCFCV